MAVAYYENIRAERIGGQLGVADVMGTIRAACKRMAEIYVWVFNPCFTGEHNPT